MSVDLAKREDMAENISSTTWDFGIFDESHLLKGKRKSLFERLTSSGALKKCLLLSCIESSGLSDVETITINAPDVIGWDQKPIYSQIKKTITQLCYNRTVEEVEFLNSLQKFANQLSSQWSYGKLQSSVIFQASLSSIYTVEVVLRRIQETWKSIRNKVSHNISLVGEDIAKIQQHIGTFTDDLEITHESNGCNQSSAAFLVTQARKIHLYGLVLSSYSI